jgi:cyanophycin synthetase
VRVKAVVPAATFRDGFSVINADDDFAQQIARLARGHIVYFATSEANELVQEHLRSRGLAVFLREQQGSEWIVVAEGKRQTAILDIAQIPATFEGRARFNVKNALAAAAACYVSDMPLEAIRHGLRTFATSFYQTPGRLNMLQVGHAHVLVDYCHNLPGLLELGDFLSRLNARERIGVLTMPGDRRDEDIVAFGSHAAGIFDRVVIREDERTRGRARGEIAGLLKRAMLERGMPEERITTVLDEVSAAHAGIDMAVPEDLVVILVDKPAKVWDTILRRAATPVTAAAPSPMVEVTNPGVIGE